MPMIGKVDEDDIHRNDDVNDYMIQLQYDNPETDIHMGVFYQVRKANGEANDSPVGGAPGEPLGGAAIGATDELDMQVLNVYALKDTERFRLGVEASFLSGKSGVVTPAGSNVSYNGYGIAGEFEWRP